MTYNAELLLAISVGIVAVITFIVSIRIRYKQQIQREMLMQELKASDKDEEENLGDEIIAIRSLGYRNSQQSSGNISKKSAPVWDGRPFNNKSEHKPLSKSQQENFVSDSKKLHENNVSSETYQEQILSDKTTSSYSDLIVLYLLAKNDEQFIGYDLLQSLLSAGFRFGDMSIFHRHEKTNGEGTKLFSLASATESGTFDINKMGNFSCKGLCLFMQLQGPLHNMQTLDLFLKTAEQLAEDLNASLLGADRKLLSTEMKKTYAEWVKSHMKEFTVQGELG